MAYQPLNLGDGLPENLLKGMYAKTEKSNHGCGTYLRVHAYVHVLHFEKKFIIWNRIPVAHENAQRHRQLSCH
jgi:hypothetical protein